GFTYVDIRSGAAATKVYYVLEGPPVGVMTEEEQRKREQDETLCRGYILKDFTLDQSRNIYELKRKLGSEKNLNGAQVSKINLLIQEHQQRKITREKGLHGNSSKNNKKDKKPLSTVVWLQKCVEQVDTTEITAMVSEMNIGMIQELHMASVTTTDDWWYDSGATTYVCNNRDLFKTYKETADGHEVMMGDNHTSKVIGSGNVEIQFTSGKKLTLMNVLHVPNIRKNLVSGFKLCKSGVNAVIESDKVNVFVGKAYACDGITTPFTPQQNGVAERKNRVLQDMINAIAPRRSERARKERNLDPDFIDSQAMIFLVEGDNEHNVINKITVLLNVEDAPKTYKEAITSRNSAFWKEAIDDEMDSLVSNNTWELSNLPPGSKAIGCRWVFRIKYHTDGSVQTFKARMLFALALIYNLPIHQMDVKTAFLNGDLDEEVFMKQPEGFCVAWIIDKFQHLNIEEANTPYESSCKMVENNERAIAQVEYASAIVVEVLALVAAGKDSRHGKKICCIDIEFVAYNQACQFPTFVIVNSNLSKASLIRVSIYTLNEVYIWKLKGFTYVDIRSGAAATKVPQQRDNEESELYALYYIKLFVETAPESFSTSSGYPYFMKINWFNSEGLDSFRKALESRKSSINWLMYNDLTD
ncbi:zinc finger, CCHC-type containing protein, partial [Tanacetum coccineum]